MERKIQDDTYRFSVLADLLKRKKQGESFLLNMMHASILNLPKDIYICTLTS